MPSLEFRLPPFTFNLLVAAIVFAISVVFWKLRLIGGGDVKYLAHLSLDGAATRRNIRPAAHRAGAGAGAGAEAALQLELSRPRHEASAVREAALLGN